MSVKAIFFDFDGVLTTDKSGSTSSAKYFSKKLGVSIEELLAIYKKDYADADHRIDVGEALNSEIWQSMSERYGIKYKPEDMIQAFADTPIDSKMLEFARKLKEKFIVGIITDNGAERTAYIFNKHKFDKIFNPIIVSADVKATKGGTEIFDLAASRAGAKPSECIFIDNTKKNIVSANKAGFIGIYFDDAVRDYEKLFSEVENETK